MNSAKVNQDWTWARYTWCTCLVSAFLFGAIALGVICLSAAHEQRALRKLKGKIASLAANAPSGIPAAPITVAIESIIHDPDSFEVLEKTRSLLSRFQDASDQELFTYLEISTRIREVLFSALEETNRPRHRDLVVGQQSIDEGADPLSLQTASGLMELNYLVALKLGDLENANKSIVSLLRCAEILPRECDLIKSIEFLGTRQRAYLYWKSALEDCILTTESILTILKIAERSRAPGELWLHIIEAERRRAIFDFPCSQSPNSTRDWPWGSSLWDDLHLHESLDELQSISIMELSPSIQATTKVIGRIQTGYNATSQLTSREWRQCYSRLSGFSTLIWQIWRQETFRQILVYASDLRIHESYHQSFTPPGKKRMYWQLSRGANSFSEEFFVQHDLGKEGAAIVWGPVWPKSSQFQFPMSYDTIPQMDPAMTSSQADFEGATVKLHRSPSNRF
ncbi:MAG: hypothetical protein KGQ60_02720 [Planctomycetes bacterium]|nr:hypothetical protein [Planctomycetota bacterium]